MKQIIPIIFVLFLVSCGGNSSELDEQTDQYSVDPIELYGNTQGTTFAILCNDSIDISMDEVVSILANFDQALSGYIPTSVISKLNQLTSGEYSYEDEYGYFNRCYEMAYDVYTMTSGDFDPTVYPLVDGWGFLKNIEEVPDSNAVDSLRALLGFQKGYHFDYLSTDSTNLILKKTPNAKLDFNAIAQGLAVDVLAEELEKRGAANYFVEIGGEIRVKGLNSEGEVWRIGIDKPVEKSTADDRVIQEVIQLKNKSIATSGSYRKFYEKNGVKYSHTLDPKTGYPVTHSLLSTTVIAESCAMADAMATAFMVMGTERAIDFVKQHPELNIDVYFIFINEHDNYETYYTPAFGKMILM